MRREREFADLRRESGAILSQNGNRLTLMLALIFCLFSLGLYFVIGYAFSACLWLLEENESALVCLSLGAQAVLYLFVRLLAVPLLSGLVRIADCMRRGESVSLTALFYGFSTYTRYRRTLRLTRCLMWLGYGTALLAAGTYGLFASLPTVTLTTALLCALVIALEIVGAVVLSFRAYPVLYWGVCRESLSMREVKREAHRRIPSPTAAGARFLLGWIHWIALGILTLGVLLLADVLPRMLVSYCCDCADDGENEEI